MSSRQPGPFFHSALRILGFGIAAGLVYALVSREWDDPIAMENGIIIGLFGSLFIIYFEFVYENPLNQKMKFIRKVTLKSLSYTIYFALLIPLVISFNRSIESGATFMAYLTGPFVSNYIENGEYYTIILYTLFLCSTVIFTRQLSLKMGHGVLWNFITGKYHRAREEDRIFMFLDINNSTSIAEKLGDIEYNKFLNTFFFDITGSILRTYGEIYRYVGDEVVVTWPLRKGLKNANCIRTFFLARQSIRKEREKYLLTYGIVPEFTAGFHCGTVIVGEIGDVKSQIVFNGAVLYTTGMIEKSCHRQNTAILVSEELIKRISLPPIYDLKQAGEITTDTGEKLPLYSVTELEMASS
jgi:adenylate cyclase